MSKPIGRVLKEARKKKGYSVLDVRKLFFQRYQVPISDKTIYAWENNSVIPSTENFLRICSIYNLKDLSVFIDFESNDDISSLTEEDKYLLYFYHHNKRPKKVIQQITEMPAVLRSI